MALVCFACAVCHKHPISASPVSCSFDVVVRSFLSTFTVSLQFVFQCRNLCLLTFICWSCLTNSVQSCLLGLDQILLYAEVIVIKLVRINGTLQSLLFQPNFGRIIWCSASLSHCLHPIDFIDYLLLNSLLIVSYTFVWSLNSTKFRQKECVAKELHALLPFGWVLRSVKLRKSCFASPSAALETLPASPWRSCR